MGENFGDPWICLRCPENRCKIIPPPKKKGLKGFKSLLRFVLMIAEEEGFTGSISRRELTVVVHAGEIGDVQDHPARQAWTSIPGMGFS